MYNNFFTICSLFYIVLLTIVFYYKKRLQSIENKIYTWLMLSNLCTIITAIIAHFTIRNADVIPLLNDIVSKLLLIFMWAWGTFFTLYVIAISFKEKKKDAFPVFFSWVIKAVVVLSVAISIAIIILPLYYSTGDVAYSYGPSANVLYIATFTYIIAFFVCIFYNYKNLRTKKYIPLFMFIIIGTGVIIIQKQNPGLLLISAMETFVTFIMYFTIENPDLQLINELNIAKDSAEKANRAKTEFLSNMSHEIRTPLNAIVGFSQALLEEKVDEEAKSEIKDIVYASDTLLEIVNGILDISKIEANKLEIIESNYDFKKMCESIITLTKSRIGEDKPVEFRAEIDQSIPDVLMGDHARVKQIIINLLTNAVKYTKEGFIEFKVSNIIIKNTCRLIISVEDSGIGIKEENISKLFTKFERLGVEKNTTVEGTGLGLAITKKLLELMRGKIVVQSKFGEGSKFTVAIDQKIVQKINDDTVPIKIVTNESLDFSKKKILIVDDNMLNIKVAQRLLKDYKVKITSCISGNEAIEILDKDDSFDLILMDDMMPKKSGTETYKELRNDISFDIPVVVLTANAISGMKEKYLEIGFNDYLAKPIEKDELDRVVKKFLK